MALLAFKSRSSSTYVHVVPLRRATIFDSQMKARASWKATDSKSRVHSPILLILVPRPLVVTRLNQMRSVQTSDEPDAVLADSGDIGASRILRYVRTR